MKKKTRHLFKKKEEVLDYSHHKKLIQKHLKSMLKFQICF